MQIDGAEVERVRAPLKWSGRVDSVHVSTAEVIRLCVQCGSRNDKVMCKLKQR